MSTKSGIAVVLTFASGGNLKLVNCWRLGDAIVGTTPSGDERVFADYLTADEVVA